MFRRRWCCLCIADADENWLDAADVVVACEDCELSEAEAALDHGCAGLMTLLPYLANCSIAWRYFGFMNFAKTIGSGDGDRLRCFEERDRDRERERDRCDRDERRDRERERERDRDRFRGVDDLASWYLLSEDRDLLRRGERSVRRLRSSTGGHLSQQFFAR